MYIPCGLGNVNVNVNSDCVEFGTDSDATNNIRGGGGGGSLLTLTLPKSEIPVIAYIIAEVWISGHTSM